MKVVIKKPLISEKNTSHLANGVYVFEVDKSSTKTEIRREVEQLFKVKVLTVKTMQERGKSRRTKFGVSKPKYFKKALVKLAAGHKIGLFEGV